MFPILIQVIAVMEAEMMTSIRLPLTAFLSLENSAAAVLTTKTS
jgi:hypothetical protein